MPKRISMRDIAAQAGVSVMTVSLTLRRSPRISPATREKVQAIADALGFQPDPALRALVQYRRGKHDRPIAGTIAYINNTTHPTVLKGPGVHLQTFTGAKERAVDLGYRVEEFWLNAPDLTPERSSEILRARGIQGLIIGPQEHAHSQIDLQWEHFSVVKLGFSLERPKLNVVAWEAFKAMLLCVNALAELGYRRVGLIIRPDQDERVQNRYAGAYYASVHAHRGMSRGVPILRMGDLEEEVILRWFRRYRPDAIIGPDPLIITMLENEGFRVPGQVGFVSPFTANWKCMPAHADGRPFEIGRVAAEYVSNMIDRNETGIPESPRTMTVEPIWVPGHTVRRMESPRHRR